jgi:NADH-quinone oxidoreductase subunit H
MSTTDIIEAQTLPFLLVVPLSAIIFFISSLAETGRTPFDLLEADSEIVAGFHIEYSGMKFAMFFLAEFLGTFFFSGFFAVVYLGGWNIPIINLIISAFGLGPIDLDALAFGRLLGLVVFFMKTFAMYFVFVWVRGTLPRVRIDQMLNLNWKFMVPLTLAMVFVAAVLDKLLPTGMSAVSRGGMHLLSNILLAYVTLEILRWQGRKQRAKLEAQDEIEPPVVETAVAH